MTRVAMFTNTFAPMIGGVERAIANVHEDINKAGHLCRVITPVFKGAEHSTGGVLRMPALTGIGEKEFSLPLPATSRLEHWMEAIDPTLIHSHQPFLLGDTAWRVARLRRVPLIFTHHTLYERYAHYLRMDPERASRLVMEMTTRYANRCDLVIAPTESIRRMLLERAVQVPVEVAPSGIDWPLYASGSRMRGRRSLGISEVDEVIGHVGRLSQEKNLEFLLRAVMHSLHLRPPAKFLLIGDGDRLEWARAMFAKESLAHRLIAPGIITGDALADVYAAMDVFAFASLTDTQGLVLAEAMAAAVPIIALDAPGARDCVLDTVTGHIVAATASEADFAACSVQLLSDTTKLRHMAARAQQHSRQFSRRNCLRRLLQVYERAAAEYRSDTMMPDARWEQLAERFDVEWIPFWEKVTTAFRMFSSRVDDGDSALRPTQA